MLEAWSHFSKCRNPLGNEFFFYFFNVIIAFGPFIVKRMQRILLSSTPLIPTEHEQRTK